MYEFTIEGITIGEVLGPGELALTNQEYITMRIAQARNLSPVEVDGLPLSEVHLWECFFYDEAKVQSKEYNDARKTEASKMDMSEIGKASNVITGD